MTPYYHLFDGTGYNIFAFLMFLYLFGMYFYPSMANIYNGIK